MEREYKFPQILKYLIKKKGLKLEEAAEAMKIGYRTLQNWLYGGNKPNLTALMMVAEYFNVSLDFLVYGEKGK